MRNQSHRNCSVVFVPHLYSYTRADEENQSDGAGDFNLRADVFQSYTLKGIALVQMMSYVLSISCILFLVDLMLGCMAEKFVDKEKALEKAARKVKKLVDKVTVRRTVVHVLAADGTVEDIEMRRALDFATVARQLPIAVFMVLAPEIALRLLSRWTIKWFGSHSIAIGLSAMLVAWELSGAVDAVHDTFWKLPVALAKTSFRTFSKMVGGDDSKKKKQ